MKKARSRASPASLAGASQRLPPTSARTVRVALGTPPTTSVCLVGGSPRSFDSVHCSCGANTLVPPQGLLWPSKISLTLLPFVPVGWLRTLRERRLARSFSGVPSVPQEDQAFWRDYQHGLISRLSKAELLDMYRLGIDLMQSFRFEPGDLASWPGRVLILESDEDILTPERRAKLRSCYPQARVHTFHGAGHAPWMSHREEYLSVIKEFLDEQ